MGSQRVGHDWVTFTFTSLSRKHMSHTQVLLTPFVCLLFFQVKIMFLKKVASSARNSHSCAVFLETIAALQHARGLHVNCHPQSVIKRCVSKGWDLIKLTISSFIKDRLGSDSCDMVGCVVVSSWAPRPAPRKEPFYPSLPLYHQGKRPHRQKKGCCILEKGLPWWLRW